MFIPSGFCAFCRSTAFCASLLHLVLIGSALPSLASEVDRFAGPDGWRVMCAATPRYCNTTPSQPAPPLKPAELAELAAVNRAVNAAILGREEPAGQDVWRLAPAVGDCEDYALTKKHRLILAGWPGERLRFATVVTEGDEYHAVLLVDHARGRLVLDNRFDSLREWDEVEASGYRLVAVEGAGADGAWQLTPYGTVLAMLAATAPAAAR